MKNCKIYRLIIVLIVIIILSACSQDSNDKSKYIYKNYKILKEPTKQITLKPKRVNKNFELLRPNLIGLVKDYLIVIDRKAEHIVKVIDTKTNSVVKEFGFYGQGPSDFVGAVDIMAVPDNKDEFWIYDISTSKMKKFNINNILNDDCNPLEILNLAKGYEFPKKLIILSNNKMIGTGIFRKGRFKTYDMKGNILQTLGKLPIILKKDHPFTLQHSHGFMGDFTINTKTNNLYLTPLRSDIIEKYDIKGKLIATLHGPEQFYPEYEIFPVKKYHTHAMGYTKKTRHGYTQIEYNKALDKTFLLYSGRFIVNKEKNKGRSEFNSIYVLSNKDVLTEKLIFNKDVLKICISQNGKTIYGLTYIDIFKFQYAE